ncbi:PH domain-containing protein, partial [Oenococcus oeni]
PIARVQNVTLSAGPVLQWQKPEKVVVATASSSHKIDGLKDDTARRLRDQIMHLALEARDE